MTMEVYYIKKEEWEIGGIFVNRDYDNEVIPPHIGQETLYKTNMLSVVENQLKECKDDIKTVIVTIPLPVNKKTEANVEAYDLTLDEMCNMIKAQRSLM